MVHDKEAENHDVWGADNSCISQTKHPDTLRPPSYRSKSVCEAAHTHNTTPKAGREGPMIDKEDNPFTATEDHMLMATRGARLTEVVCVLGPVEGTREH